MRIGLYGMPSSGKSSIMKQLDFIETVEGSKMLRILFPDFDIFDESGRARARKALAQKMLEKTSFIMDGHYAFGNEVAFTEDDGKMYDVFLYLYISPEVLKERMALSPKNKKYLIYNIEEWQTNEINSLKEFCHQNNKDFYVIDNPPDNYFDDLSEVVRFIQDIVSGYSCVKYAEKCAEDIINRSVSDTVILLDGDKTLTIEDTSRAIFGYKTHIYDGNFYTGYQAWRQKEEFTKYVIDVPMELPVHFNEKIIAELSSDACILTSGNETIWSHISTILGIKQYCGMEMSAETKLFITKRLQEAGKKVIAYGDGMNDYYMLKQANKGFLVTRQDASISRSLIGRDLEGLSLV